MNSAAWDLHGLSIATICVAIAAILLVLAIGYVVWDTARRRGKPPKCSRCGYLLIGLNERRCPECGQLFSEWGFIDNTAPPGDHSPHGTRDYQETATGTLDAGHSDGDGE